MAQLFGRKQWMLAPPSAWEHLHAYPFLHPGHAQCQTRFTSLSNESLSLAGVTTVDSVPLVVDMVIDRQRAWQVRYLFMFYTSMYVS